MSSILWNIFSLIIITTILTLQFENNLICAVLLIAALFIHECGHWIAMILTKIPIKKFRILPIGLCIEPAEPLNEAKTEAFIGIMGPLFGLLASTIFALIAFFTSQVSWAILACFSSLLNFVNLLPIYPLDGGRVANAIASSINEKFRRFVQTKGRYLCLLIALTGNLIWIIFFFLIGTGVKEERVAYTSGILTYKGMKKREGCAMTFVYCFLIYAHLKVIFTVLDGFGSPEQMLTFLK